MSSVNKEYHQLGVPKNIVMKDLSSRTCCAVVSFILEFLLIFS